MSYRDISSVSRLHLKVFPGYFTSELGEKFLTTYYNNISESRNGIGLVCECEGDSEIVGFITGIINPRLFYEDFLRRHGVRIALALLPRVIGNPAMVLKLVKGLEYPSKSPEGEDLAIISSLGIKPECQGKGLGSLLLDRLEKETAERGIRRLVTGAKKREIGVIAFYQKAGFQIDEDLDNPGYGDSALLTKVL